MATATLQDRIAGALAALAVMAALGYLLVIGLTVTRTQGLRTPITLISIQVPPPPQPPPRRPPVRPRPRRTAEQGKPGGATPKPVRVPLLSTLPVPVVQVATPAVPRPVSSSSGDGTGSGAGRGAGAGEDGRGGRGGGGVDVPPRLIKGRLSFSDLPAAMVAQRVEGMVTVRYEVEIDGRVGACAPVVSSGNAQLDERTCQLIQRRFRFEPSRDRQGDPVRSTIEEDHSWELDKAESEDRATPGPPPR